MYEAPCKPPATPRGQPPRPHAFGRGLVLGGLRASIAMRTVTTSIAMPACRRRLGGSPLAEAGVAAHGIGIGIERHRKASGC